MARISFLDCPHKNVQQFTECCLDCGYNIYMTEKEYKKRLKEEARERGIVDPETRRLEKQLGIKTKKGYDGNIDPVTGQWDGDPPDSGMW